MHGINCLLSELLCSSDSLVCTASLYYKSTALVSHTKYGTVPHLPHFRHNLVAYPSTWSLIECVHMCMLVYV